MLIAEAALHCFTTNGFYATSVDDIASRAATSRATLYQYFESKESIFIELMVESGTALARELRHLGDLGPDADGYANMRRWMGAICRIYDTYAPMFIEWANVNAPHGSLRAEVAGYVDFHVERLSRRLVAAGIAAERAPTASVVVLGIYTRFNYIRHVYRPGPSAPRLVDSLSCALQRYLFPATPDRVLAGGPRLSTAEEWPDVTAIGPLGELRPTRPEPSPDPFKGVSEQAAGTVRQLLDAAGRVFAHNGYQAANVDQIVGEAELARGTFYRYFNDKSELIVVLSREASAAMLPLFEEFERFASDQDPVQLRTWLRRFLAVQRTYAGVMRAWTESPQINPGLLVGAAEVVDALGAAVRATFGPQRTYPLDRRAAGMLLSSLLEHVPNEGAGSHYMPTDDQIVEEQAGFIERVLLPTSA
jgi:AcrR family transcriptional regulator